MGGWVEINNLYKSLHPNSHQFCPISSPSLSTCKNLFSPQVYVVVSMLIIQYCVNGATKQFYEFQEAVESCSDNGSNITLKKSANWKYFIFWLVWLTAFLKTERVAGNKFAMPWAFVHIWKQQSDENLLKPGCGCRLKSVLQNIF